MKVLKGFANFVLTVALISFLTCLSFTFIIKNVFQEEIITGIAIETIEDKYVESDELNLTSEQKDIIKDILNKEETKEIIDIVIDNYLSYTVNENYNLSKKDYDVLFKYASEHMDAISKLSENVNIDEVKNNLTYDNINQMAKDGFALIDSEGGIELSEDNIEAINIYARLVSSEVRGYILALIGFTILLLMLVNWSVSKWLLEAGISLIITGTFVNAIYGLSELMKDLLKTEGDIGKYIANIDLKYTLIIGVAEIAIGIALIVINSKINKLEKENI